jgi:hypothetical protein
VVVLDQPGEGPTAETSSGAIYVMGQTFKKFVVAPDITQVLELEKAEREARRESERVKKEEEEAAAQEAMRKAAEEAKKIKAKPKAPGRQKAQTTKPIARSAPNAKSSGTA